MGSHIADELSKSGYSVIRCDRFSSPWLRDDQEILKI
jgi:nucleoside-diphosphate-sugar epimerase